MVVIATAINICGNENGCGLKISCELMLCHQNVTPPFKHPVYAPGSAIHVQGEY